MLYHVNNIKTDRLNFSMHHSSDIDMPRFAFFPNKIPAAILSAFLAAGSVCIPVSAAALSMPVTSRSASKAAQSALKATHSDTTATLPASKATQSLPSTPQSASYGFADAGTPDASLLDPSGNPLQVVIFGDSQFDRDRTPSGIAAQLAEATHTIVYNAAIGATTAACLDRSPISSTNSASEESDSESTVSSDGAASISNEDRSQPTNHPPEGPSVKSPVKSSVESPADPFPETPRPGNPYRDPGLLGHVFSAVGLTTPEEAFPGHWSALVMEHCPMEETDVFVLEYGINDFNARVPLLDSTDASYGEALSEGIQLLKSAFPNAKILLCGPGYCQFYDTGRNLIGDSDTLSNGLFPVADYCTVAGQVAANLGIAYFDAYEALGIDSKNADIYLEPDGVHYTAEGRSLYASKLSTALLEALGDTDPADEIPPVSNQAANVDNTSP